MIFLCRGKWKQKPKSSALCVKSTAKEDECTAVSVAKMMNALCNTSRIFSLSLFVFFLFLQNNKLVIDFTGKVLSNSDSASFLADSVLSAYSIIIISLCFLLFNRPISLNLPIRAGLATVIINVDVLATAATGNRSTFDVFIACCCWCCCLCAGVSHINRVLVIVEITIFNYIFNKNDAKFPLFSNNHNHYRQSIHL